MSNDPDSQPETATAHLDLTPFAILFDTPERVVEPLSWAEHIPFAYFLMQLHQPRVLVELGVHSGNSYTAFCQAADRLGLPTSCYGVDTWEGDAHAGHYENNVYESLNGFHKTRYAKFSNLMRMTFDEARDYFSDGSIDLLHIDGLHTYEAVRHDFDTWLPKMSKRGLVLFHDIQVKERDFGVWQLWEEVSGRYPSIHLRNSHGLGVAFVGEDLPGQLGDFFTAFSASDFYPSLFHKLGRAIAADAQQKRDLAELENVSHKAQQRCSTLEQNLEQKRERITALGEENAGYHHRIQEMNQQLQSNREDASALRQKIHDLQERITERAERMEGLNQQLVAANQKTNETARELLACQRKLEATEERLAKETELLDTIRSTRLWRWSAPLRDRLRRNGR
jgi:uncharacterized protein (UPF0335 family)